jgi:flavodoxin
MSIGIFYYSRTGNTRSVAAILEKKLRENNKEVKLVEIEAGKKPGFLRAGYSGFRQKELPVKNTGFDVHDFDRILVGCPVWAGRPAPFIKTFFQKASNGKGKPVGFFFTSGSVSAKTGKTPDLMKSYATENGFEPLGAFLAVQMKKNTTPNTFEAVDDFLQKILKK